MTEKVKKCDLNARKNYRKHKLFKGQLERPGLSVDFLSHSFEIFSGHKKEFSFIHNSTAALEEDSEIKNNKNNTEKPCTYLNLCV